MEWVWIFAAPKRILDVGDLSPIARVGIAGIENGAIVLAQIIHHAQESSIGRKANLVTGREDPVEFYFPVVSIDLRDRILIRRVLVELQEGHRLEVLLGIEDDLAPAQPDHGRCPAAGRMPDGSIRAGEAVHVVAGDRPLFDEQLTHRHHFPFDLLTLGAEVIVFAGLRVGIDPGDLEHAALLPSVSEIAHVGHPVIFQCRDDPRGPALEAGRDVLLPVGDEIAIGALGINRYMHAQSQTCRFRHVFHQLHLRAVKADAVNVETFSRRLDVGGDAVDQGILAALGAVDPFEALGRICAGEGAEVV